MSAQKSDLRGGRFGAALAIRVIPGASRNEVAEILDDGTIRIRLTAPPVEGRANAALIDFLSKILDIPKSKIEIIAGHSRRDKLVSILDVDAETIQARIVGGKH
jgi:uncharacterized protein (TIGR00251 family)